MIWPPNICTILVHIFFEVLLIEWNHQKVTQQHTRYLYQVSYQVPRSICFREQMNEKSDVSSSKSVSEGAIVWCAGAKKNTLKKWWSGGGGGTSTRYYTCRGLSIDRDHGRHKTQNTKHIKNTTTTTTTRETHTYTRLNKKKKRICAAVIHFVYIIGIIWAVYNINYQLLSSFILSCSRSPHLRGFGLSLRRCDYPRSDLHDAAVKRNRCSFRLANS